MSRTYKKTSGEWGVKNMKGTSSSKAMANKRLAAWAIKTGAKKKK